MVGDAGGGCGDRAVGGVAVPLLRVVEGQLVDAVSVVVGVIDRFGAVALGAVDLGVAVLFVHPGPIRLVGRGAVADPAGGPSLGQGDVRQAGPVRHLVGGFQGEVVALAFGQAEHFIPLAMPRLAGDRFIGDLGGRGKVRRVDLRCAVADVVLSRPADQCVVTGGRPVEVDRAGFGARFGDQIGHRRRGGDVAGVVDGEAAGHRFAVVIPEDPLLVAEAVGGAYLDHHAAGGSGGPDAVGFGIPGRVVAGNILGDHVAGAVGKHPVDIVGHRVAVRIDGIGPADVEDRGRGSRGGGGDRERVRPGVGNLLVNRQL